MPETPPPSPYREALVAVLPDALREEMERIEDQYRKDIEEALAAKGRAMEFIRTIKDRPFEVQEHELEQEHDQLVRQHTAKFCKRLRWILEAYKDTQEE